MTGQSPYESALTRFPAVSVRHLLEMLLLLRGRANAGENVSTPYITLHLHSGRDLSGWLLALAQDEGETHVLLHTSPNQRQPDYAASYLPMRAVEAVTVHDATAYAPTFSFGKVAMPPGTAAPTKMELRRRADAASADLTSLMGAPLAVAIESIPDDDDGRYQAAAALDALISALRRIAADEIGRAALRQKARAALLVVGETAAVRLENEALRIETTLTPGEPAGWYDLIAQLL